MKWGRALAVIGCSLALAACSGSHGQPSTNGGNHYGLIQAQYPDCARQGAALASYLDTGKPTSDDPTYGPDRQTVLSLNGQQRALYIRMAADMEIQTCDTNEQQAIQQQAAERAAALAQAQQQAQAAAQAAAQAKAEGLAQPVCQTADGQVSWDGSTLVCRLRYIGNDGATYSGEANMDPASGQFQGKMDTAGTGATEQECTSGYYQDLSTGPGYGPKGKWLAVPQICIPVS